MPQITITKLMDGAKHAAFHVAIAGDGGGDLSDETVIDPAVSFDPALPAVAGMTIECLHYDLTGFDARLEFDDLVADTLVWSMTGDQYAYADLCEIGGLKDRSSQDGLGKLKLSTSGLGMGEYGTLILKVRKD